MACETVAWFMFGGERDDYMFDPGVNPYSSGLEWIRAIVAFRRYIRCC
jgi:hypothetical protein